MNTIYDTIVWLQSDATKKRFPIVVFTADTDMATMGSVSLTSMERSEIVVTQLTGEEFSAVGKNRENYKLVEQRINRELHRTDLACAWLIRVEESQPTGSGRTFQMFRETYQRPKLFYRDIFSENSLAEELSCTTLSEFEKDGGKVIVLP
ncbi:hypothetical protein [Burkholderia territorii]|uniref:hypothetical protein n=1 Tax=Burkholderia territorii TaxID=1503055 RepID=UPI00075373AC|nr:hypothetical protein [Burkholderia territorii]KWO50059.1 hypothetical protein WT98_17160 [Burkholderia territorii]